MTKISKLIQRLQSTPKDFEWEELVKVLAHYGFTEKTGSGSRRKFIHTDGRIISLHEPHPQKIVKRYALKLVIDMLVIQNRTL